RALFAQQGLCLRMDMPHSDTMFERYGGLPAQRGAGRASAVAHARRSSSAHRTGNRGYPDRHVRDLATSPHYLSPATPRKTASRAYLDASVSARMCAMYLSVPPQVPLRRDLWAGWFNPTSSRVVRACTRTARGFICRSQAAMADPGSIAIGSTTNND